MTQKREIFIVKINNVWGQIVCEDYEVIEGAYQEFGVFADGYYFDKRYKAGIWDGKIRGVRRDGTFYLGLYKDVLEYLSKQSEYTTEIDPKFANNHITNKEEYKEEYYKITNDMLTSVNSDVSPRYYQWRATLKAYYNKRMIVEHCTGSGKSLSITMLINFILHKHKDFKILVLVPRIDLVEQMTEDYIGFGIPKELIGKFTGKFKDFDEPIIVSTWQSMHTQDFLLKKFNVIIADECHGLKAEVVRSVAENAINAEFRFGFTGTMPDPKAEKMLIIGVLGFVGDVVKVAELAEQKMIAVPKIHIPYLKYTKEEMKLVKANQATLEGKDAYIYEQKFLFNHDLRNELIVKISKKFISRNQNMLILVNKHEHCETIKNKLIERGITPIIVTGEVKDIEVRNRVRKQLEESGGQVILATTGVYSTGISIKRIHAIIFAAPGKSKIQTLQSVGRGLRLDKRNDKTELYLYDFADDFKYASESLAVRMEYYARNEFNVKTKEIDLYAEIHEHIQE
jgi:superfamily II DNA or RNA helicase